MTTQEASELFRIDKKIISDLCKQGLVHKAFKNKSKKWDIPDDTRVILDKNAIAQILFQILKVKNKKDTPVSLKYIDNIDKLEACLNYLYIAGYLYSYDKTKANIIDMLESSILSENGLNFIAGAKIDSQKKEIYLIKNLNIFSINSGINL